MNIHGLNNRDEENPPQGNQRPLMGNGGGQNGGNPFTMGMQNNTTDPRQETFIQMIYLNFCPSAMLKSFVVYISLTLLIVFIVQLGVGKKILLLFVKKINLKKMEST
jgi:hypothetical protein